MILLKTETGQQVFKDRSVRLTPRQRSAFILFDGKRSVDEILSSCAGVASEDIDQMISLGLLSHGGAVSSPWALSAPSDAVAEPTPLPKMPSAPEVAAAETAVEARPPQQRYKDAYPIATQLTGALGLRGFRLNLAVEGTSSYDELLALAPKIRAAVKPDQAAALDRALGL